MATTREKYKRTHSVLFRCDRCKLPSRVIKTKTGDVRDPLFLMESPSGKAFPKVCRLCRRVLEGAGYHLYLSDL